MLQFIELVRNQVFILFDRQAAVAAVADIAVEDGHPRIGFGPGQGAVVEGLGENDAVAGCDREVDDGGRTVVDRNLVRQVEVALVAAGQADEAGARRDIDQRARRVEEAGEQC